jgi:hypothetical protein
VLADVLPLHAGGDKKSDQAGAQRYAVRHAVDCRGARKAGVGPAFRAESDG